MRAERGTILIQVAVALLALTLFSALAIDQGIFYVARRQAQNSADAGALAAAIHLLFNPADESGAREAARAVSHENAVWLEQPAAADVLVDLPITCPPGSGTSDPKCVRVDVLRGAIDRNGATHTNPLPTIFATLAGITDQRISATATAQVTQGNAVECLKPFAVPDKWADNDEESGGWTQVDTFTPPTDVYTRPGFTVETDYGTELVLKTGAGNDWSAGWMQLLTFTDDNGANVLPEEISSCPSWVPPVAIYDGTWPCESDNDANPAHGCIAVKNGNAQGPTVKQGLGDLVDLDDEAYWDGTQVAGGCMATEAGCTSINPAGLNLSPRIVPIALFDPSAYYNSGCAGSNCAIQITNLLGFFVEGTCEQVYGSTLPPYCGTNADAKKRILGRIINYPGQFLNTGGPTTSTFTQVVRLVR